MALVHATASITPGKAELIAAWLPSQPWGPPDTTDLEQVGSYRLDDPEGEVGTEVLFVVVGETTYQVPLTYRAAPLADAEPGLVGTMDHTVLGQRWIYHGLSDPVFLRAISSATATGVGQSANQAFVEDRWIALGPSARLSGHGFLSGAVEIDGLAGAITDGAWTRLRNEHLELAFANIPGASHPNAAGAVLTGTWKGRDTAAVLAVLSPLG